MARRRSPTTAPTSISAASPTAATPRASSSTRPSSCACPTGSTRPGRRRSLCAGITTYSPLRHWNVRKGQKVGVVGLGGLGHMAVKFAHAFGARVVLFTTSPGKAEDAVRLGAHEVVVSKNAAEMQKHARQLRLHPRHGVGDARPERLPRAAEARRHDDPGRSARRPRCPWAPSASSSGGDSSPARSSAASARPRRCSTSAREHGITADVEVIPIQKINEAYDRLVKGDVKYRFVIDMASLKQERPK